MFTVEGRNHLLRQLIEHAHVDPEVTAAALVGSAARRSTDAWSDIDLAVRLGPGVRPADAADAWTLYVESLTPVADHLDIWAGPVLYRVLLVHDSLQVDLSFWPDEHFASTGEPFVLVFGTANPVRDGLSGTADHDDVGWAWLYALHARSAIARERPWQAMEMLDGLRGRLITLMCRRHALPTHQGRGVDGLPAPLLPALTTTLVITPVTSGLTDALRGAATLLLVEVEQLDAALADRLRAPVATLTSSLEPVTP